LGVFTISVKFSEQNTKYTKRNAKDKSKNSFTEKDKKHKNTIYI
jgi:hypothetical protein